MRLTDYRGLVLTFTLVLGACASVRPTQAAPEPASPADLANRQLLVYQQWLAEQPAPELARESRRLASVAPEPFSQLAQALLLARSRSAADLIQAQALLDKLLHNPAPEAQPWQPMARLLASLLAGQRSEQKRADEAAAEQRRLEDQLERSNQQGRDALKKSEQQAEKLDAMKAQLDSLNLKLEALKAIERSLPSRPAQGVKP